MKTTFHLTSNIFLGRKGEVLHPITRTVSVVTVFHLGKNTPTKIKHTATPFLLQKTRKYLTKLTLRYQSIIFEELVAETLLKE